MTMHLEKGLTTTSTKKRKTKITKAMQIEFERGWRDRNHRLKEMYLPKETFEQYMEWLHGTGGKNKKKKVDNTKYSQATSTIITSKEQSKYPHVDIFITEKKTAPDENSHGSIVVSRPSNWITGPCSSKPSPVYTGTKILGIGTMHKSNAVPIFSDNEAKEISSMRR